MKKLSGVDRLYEIGNTGHLLYLICLKMTDKMQRAPKYASGRLFE
jgi:hypothetical protein